MFLTLILSELLRSDRLARQCAQKWAESREQLGYPLGVWEEASHPEIIQQSSSQVFSTFSHLNRFCINRNFSKCELMLILGVCPQPSLLQFYLFYWKLTPYCLHQTDVPRTFVLEIGSEELPPQDVTSAVSQVCYSSLISPFHRISWKGSYP